MCEGDGSISGPGSDNLGGDCYTKQECDAKGGTAAGECALGYGVCCVCKYSYIQCLSKKLSKVRVVQEGITYL